MLPGIESYIATDRRISLKGSLMKQKRKKNKTKLTKQSLSVILPDTHSPLGTLAAPFAPSLKDAEMPYQTGAGVGTW